MTTKVAYIAAFLGFIVSISTSSTATKNGTVVECWYFDAGVMGAAIVTAVCATIGFFQKPGQHEQLPLRGRAVALAILLAVAALHVLRSVGIIGGPC